MPCFHACLCAFVVVSIVFLVRFVVQCFTTASASHFEVLVAYVPQIVLLLLLILLLLLFPLLLELVQLLLDLIGGLCINKIAFHKALALLTPQNVTP